MLTRKGGRTGHLNGFLEGHVVLAVDALDLDLGVAEDGDAEGLVGEQPGVEGGQGVDVVDGQELGHVDGLEGVGGGGREVNLGEGGVGQLVLEVHDALEGVDVGVDLAVRLDGAVDGHGQVLDLGIGDDDAVEDELGIVELALGDLGDGDEDAVRDDMLISVDPHGGGACGGGGGGPSRLGNMRQMQARGQRQATSFFALT